MEDVWRRSCISCSLPVGDVGLCSVSVPPVTARRRPDLLVDPEDVGAVVGSLELGQPVVVLAVGGPGPFLALVHHEVRVAGAGGVAVGGFPAVGRPLFEHLRTGEVGVDAHDDLGKGRIDQNPERQLEQVQVTRCSPTRHRSEALSGGDFPSRHMRSSRHLHGPCTTRRFTTRAGASRRLETGGDKDARS